MKKINSSKITSKYQATIPKKVREILGIQSGDIIEFEITESGVVVLRKPNPLDITYLQALEDALSEWQSDEDEI